MALSFKYKAMKRPNGTTVKSPLIPVTLTGRSSIKLDVIALIDSGADLSVIPKELQIFLNLDLRGKESNSKGIGGEVKVKNTKMNVNINKGHENYDFIVPVQVVLNDSTVPVLLGREGFFNQFKITFDQDNFIVSLKKNNEKSKFYE